MTLGLWKKINEIPPHTQMFGLDDAICQKKNGGVYHPCRLFQPNCNTQEEATTTFTTQNADIGFTSKTYRDSYPAAQYFICTVVLNVVPVTKVMQELKCFWVSLIPGAS